MRPDGVLLGATIKGFGDEMFTYWHRRALYRINKLSVASKGETVCGSCHVILWAPMHLSPTGVYRFSALVVQKAITCNMFEPTAASSVKWMDAFYRGPFQKTSGVC